MSAANAPIDEDALIAEIFAPIATSAAADGLADDAATLATHEETVVTCDALASGVHFFAQDPPDTIAAKALRVNLSDLAAKGAEPFAYLLTLALGAGATLEWVRAFADGLNRDHGRFGVELLGGDTLRASPGGGTTISITAFGRTAPGAIVRRRSARPGDKLVVTGTIGDAALGLVLRRDEGPPHLPAVHREALLARYLWPEPPVAAWRAVRSHARAAMDVSDGLIGDALKLCRSAAVCAVIEVDEVPLSPAARAFITGGGEPARDLALTGGDDYQILAAVAPEKVNAYCSDCRSHDIATSVIGELHEGRPGVSLLERGAPISVDDRRFQHF